jgi:hypothetical protein
MPVPQPRHQDFERLTHEGQLLRLEVLSDAAAKAAFPHGHSQACPPWVRRRLVLQGYLARGLVRNASKPGYSGHARLLVDVFLHTARDCNAQGAGLYIGNAFRADILAERFGDRPI